MREDSLIIADVKEGNMKAFEELVEKYTGMLFTLSMGYLHSKEDAEDMVQEIFVKLYKSIYSFREESKFSTWLYRIAVNACLNHVAKKKRGFISGIFSRTNIYNPSENDSLNIQNTPSHAKNPLEQIISHEDSYRVKKAIDSLPEKQKTALILQRYQEMTQKEIASIMHISEGAVEQHLIRAKDNIKKSLLINQ